MMLFEEKRSLFCHDFFQSWFLWFLQVHCVAWTIKATDKVPIPQDIRQKTLCVLPKQTNGEGILIQCMGDGSLEMELTSPLPY